MDIGNFEVGKSYTVSTKDWDAPDGSGTVQGKTMTVTILPAQNYGEATAFDGTKRVLATPMEVESRKEFLRVLRSDGKVHLLHPETIKVATQH